MVSATSMPWLVTGRESVVTKIVEALNPPEGGTSGPEIGMGVLLTGETGSGKGHVAAEAVKTLQSDMHVVRLRTSAHMSKEPYGALATFQCEGSPEDAIRPVQLLTATRKRLESMAEGKEVCVFVANANELDGHSAVILAQLARAGAVRLLLTCGADDRLPRELSNLVKDGWVTGLPVEPFTFSEMVTALEARMGGRLSRVAGRRLWSDSGRVPQSLSVLCDEMQKSRMLVNLGGVWCLDESVTGEMPIPTELFANQLRGLNPSERRAVEIIALARGISIDTLLALVDGHDVDALEGRGLISIDSASTVSLDSPLLAHVVRNRVPVGRRSALWEAVKVHLPMVLGSSIANEGMAIWSLECGQPIGVDMALAAARTANDTVRPRLALQLLESLEPVESSTAVTAETVRAYMILGDVTAVLEVLKVFYSSASVEPTLVDWVGLILQETHLSLSARKTWPQAESNLAKLRTELYPDALDWTVVPPGESIAALRSLLALTTAGTAWWTGNFSAALAELDHCLLASEQQEDGNALTLASQLSLTAAVAGDIRKATVIADGLGASLDHIQASSADVLRARESLFFSNLIAGRLDHAEVLARELHNYVATDATVHGPILADLALPLLAAAKGHGAQCLSLLEPELAQLRLQDQHGAFGVATSAAAYASAQSGDFEAANGYLAEVDGYNAMAPWLVERMGIYFELAARAMVGDRESSIAQLQGLADADKKSERQHWEVVSLGFALRLGAVDVAGKLLAATERCAGGSYSFYRALAEGILNNDAGLLELAAELAADNGNDAAVVDAAEAGLALGPLDAHQNRRMTALLEKSRRNMGTNSREAGDGQPLTARQLEIAALAATGASNKAIAEGLHLSIRTVEGHLYQIFGKLRISERSDLPLVIDQLVGGRS